MRETASRGGTVKAITVWHPTRNTTDADVLEADAAEMVKAEVAAVQAEEGRTTPASAEVIRGKPAEVLATAACGANLLVIGSHGANRAWHQLVGSTAEECIRRAPCPVVVIPMPHDQRD
jgi:nucleotide-binding universal stress UspA family protein